MNTVNGGDTRDKSFIRRCASDAASAIAALWDDEGGTFWRSTIQRERESASRKFFPTVSFRCVDVLLLTLLHQPDWLTAEIKAKLTSVWVPAIVHQDSKRVHSTLDIPDKNNQLNVFTLALDIQALSRVVIQGSAQSDVLSLARERLIDAVRRLIAHPAFDIRSTRSFAEARPRHGKVVDAVRQLLVRPAALNSGRLHPSPHPFLLYHAARALDLARNAIPLDTAAGRTSEIIGLLISSTRQSVEGLIAKQSLGTLSPGDSIALAFCAGILSLVGTLEDLPFVLASIKTCFEYQDANGCWPFGRVVQKDKDLTSDRLEIATYEVAAVLAEALSKYVESRQCRSDTEPVQAFIERLLLSGRYTERSAVRIFSKTLPAVGWCSDHAYGYEMIESWTSGSVLNSLVSLERLVHAQEREAILAGFTTASPKDPDWPKWLAWKHYRLESEVDHDHPILEYLDRQMVKPINADLRKLPPTNPHSVSALLFGPPGTSKTTIVKALADGLGWPLVLLSPGTFIERGLEYIESQARQVFDRLMRLSKAVVLFDECDELFRERKPSSESEQMRGITAFVTASMLPKLQELHDRGRVVFFICTNNFRSIDAAVKRGGRIDHIIGVGPPDQAARKAIIRTTYNEMSTIPSSTDPYADGLTEYLAAITARFTRPELQRATRILMQSASWSTLAEAQHEACAVADRLRPSLTITEHEYQDFILLQGSYSQPVTEAIAK